MKGSEYEGEVMDGRRFSGRTLGDAVQRPGVVILVLIGTAYSNPRFPGKHSPNIVSCAPLQCSYYMKRSYIYISGSRLLYSFKLFYFIAQFIMLRMVHILLGASYCLSILLHLPLLS